MSLALVRSFFVDVMEDLGYEEHQDAFNDANISNTYLQKGFHVLIGSGSNLAAAHDHQEILSDIEVKFFFKGFRNTLNAMNEALTEVDSLLAAALNVTTRRAGLNAGLRNVKFVNFTIEQIGDSNDNIVKVTVRFQGVLLFLITS